MRFQDLGKTSKNKIEPQSLITQLLMSLWIILFVVSTYSIMTDKLHAGGPTPG